MKEGHYHDIEAIAREWGITFYENKFNNLGEMGKFLEKRSLSEWTQKEIKNQGALCLLFK